MEGVRNKIVKACIAALFFLFTLGIYAQGQEISLRISGSLSYINPDHINQTLCSVEEFFKRFTTVRDDWNYIEGEIRDVHLSTSFEGELILTLNSRLAVGIGTGYIYLEATEERTGISLESPQDTLISVHPTTINTYPLRLSGYYFFPLKEQLRLYARCGAGLVWTKYVERLGFRVQPDENFIQILDQKATAQGYSFFSGFGFMWEANPLMHFFIEAEANLTKISGFQGETPEGETGTLFFFEEYDPFLDLWQAQNILLKQPPTGPYFRSVKEAVVDLSGFSIKIGVTITF